MIRMLEPADAVACDAIIASLPDWFGNDAGIAECAAAVRSQQGLVSEMNGRVVGFVTHRLHAPGAAELTWIAVDADFRGGGHGTALVDALVDGLRRDGVRLLSVKTLSESAGDPGYAQTRAFYLARGFAVLIELPDLWDEANPCVLMLRVL
jgi:ribosomal protein S18 acetylase RimI-like enzyme